jgi:transcriptional regulator with XRE-family HTH domain
MEVKETMSPEYRNIYQIARESAGITQEKAAELIDISVESIRAYESGRRIPPGNVVIRMVDIYDARYLAYQHLKAEEVGQKYLPEIDVKDLPSAILRLQKEVTDFLKSRDELIDITCDGIISAEELPRYQRILKELDDIVAAIMSLKCAKTG